MPSKQKRRVEVATGNPGISNNYIDMDFDTDTVVNIHGLRVESVLEPEIENANANGIWAVWVLPGEVIQNADLPTNLGQFGDEKWAPYLWGIGVWAAANQTTGKILFEPKTSRNMQKGGRIVFHLVIQGISSGLVRHNSLITCFTSG